MPCWPSASRRVDGFAVHASNRLSKRRAAMHALVDRLSIRRAAMHALADRLSIRRAAMHALAERVDGKPSTLRIM